MKKGNHAAEMKLSISAFFVLQHMEAPK